MSHAEKRLRRSRVTTNNLLHEMLSELAAPMLLIGGDKRLHFASPAFRRLADMEIDALPCDTLFHLAKSALTVGHCCWDVLDIYLASGESGLWQLRDGQDLLRPMLCEIRAIEVAGRSVMIAIEVKPLKDLISPIALSFFRCLRRSVPAAAAYEKYVAEYLSKNYGFGVTKWLRFDHSDMSAAEAALMEKLTHAIDGVDPLVRQNGLFDVIVEMNGRERIFHVFQSSHAAVPTCLVIGDTGGRFGDEVICILRAAVAAWTEPDDLPAAETRAINLAVIELLSATEREILGCLRKGMSDKEIARLRRVSINTVRNQVCAVMHKIGVSKRIHLAAFSLADIHED